MKSSTVSSFWLLVAILSLSGCGNDEKSASPPSSLKTWTIDSPENGRSICYDFNSGADSNTCDGKNWDIRITGSTRGGIAFRTNSGSGYSGDGGVFVKDGKAIHDLQTLKQIISEFQDNRSLLLEQDFFSSDSFQSQKKSSIRPSSTMDFFFPSDRSNPMIVMFRENNGKCATINSRTFELYPKGVLCAYKNEIEISAVPYFMFSHNSPRLPSGFYRKISSENFTRSYKANVDRTGLLNKHEVTGDGALDYGFFSYDISFSNEKMMKAEHHLTAWPERAALIKAGEGDSYATFRLLNVTPKGPSKWSWSFEFEVHDIEPEKLP